MKTKVQEAIKLVAENMEHLHNDTKLKEVCPIGIIDIDNWEWAQGIGIYGMFKYYQQTKDISTFNWIISWYDRAISRGLPEHNINTTAPMLTLAFLCEIVDRADWLQLCEEWANWIMNGLVRTPESGFQHIVTGEENKGQLWDDTIFMTVLFLAKAGVMFKRQDMLDECERQILLHIKYLYDKKTGLWFHGWTFEGKHNFADALWGRGNCWITAGIPEYLEITNVEGGFRLFLIDTLKAQIDTLIKLQNANGMWHTLLNDSSSYVETSATAGFGYGILKAIRMGLIDEEYKNYALKALSAVLNNIADDGTVEGVSYGTGMGRDLQFYRDIPICSMTYGQALALLLLGEALIA
jgi:unsaturated rhamnogalacturonyl hydrolase